MTKTRLTDLQARNTMPWWEFDVNVVFWLTGGAMLYIYLMRRVEGNLPGKLIPFFFALCYFVCMTVNDKHGRNRAAVFRSAVGSVGLLACLNYTQKLLPLLCVLLPLGIAAWGIYTRILYEQPVNGRQNRENVLRRRRMRSLSFARSVAAVGCTAIVLFTCIGASFHCFGLDELAQATLPASEVTECADPHEVPMHCTESAWSQMSDKEKLDFLQSVANLEAQRLGVPHLSQVRVLPIASELTAGYYSNSDQMIVIDDEHFENSSPVKLVRTVCHESCHAYQYELIARYEKASKEDIAAINELQVAKDYKKEFDHYIKGDDNFDGYYNQHCEIDARTYARDEVIKLMAGV